DRLMFAGSSEGVMLSDLEERDIDRSEDFDFSRSGFLTYTSQPRQTRKLILPAFLITPLLVSTSARLERFSQL
ncbi:hypothetical protein TELCIR_19137, partial [Teladorsagia circumcincta]